jgi:hypothetical protein
MTELLITGLHHDLSNEQEAFLRTLCVEKRSRETSGFGCALSMHLGKFAGEAKKALMAASEELASATVAMPP